ncbi:MAG: class I SAM-dependent methyltransferase [Gammaproteobacteria bacterium]|nr:class I SAM-dependent methyltransferase [Gammaproteobacteria bacterium]
MDTDSDERKEFIRQVFNTVCERYGKDSLRFFENAANHLPGLLNLRGKEQVLDIATGTGLAASRMAAFLPQGHVTGIDMSEGMLQQAEAMRQELGLNNIDYRQMDMTQLALPDAHYDVINASFAIFFVEDMDALVRHINTKIKPGGRLLSTHFAAGSMAPMQELLMRRLQDYGVEVPQAAWSQLDSEEKNRQLFAQAGLTGIEHHRHQVGYYFQHAEQWWDVVWWAGFRGFVNQLGEEKLEQFKQEHLAEVNALADKNGIFFNVEIIHSIGNKS